MAGALLACAACQREAERADELQGQILAIQSEAGDVLIKHGDIKGFMPGMTMPFRVRDRALLAGKARDCSRHGRWPPTAAPWGPTPTSRRSPRRRLRQAAR